jgi:hypothetical protein
MKQINEILSFNVCCQMNNIHFQKLLLGHKWLQRTEKGLILPLKWMCKNIRYLVLLDTHPHQTFHVQK